MDKVHSTMNIVHGLDPWTRSTLSMDSIDIVQISWTMSTPSRTYSTYAGKIHGQGPQYNEQFWKVSIQGQGHFLMTKYTKVRHPVSVLTGCITNILLFLTVLETGRLVTAAGDQVKAATSKDVSGDLDEEVVIALKTVLT